MSEATSDRKETQPNSEDARLESALLRCCHNLLGYIYSYI